MSTSCGLLLRHITNEKPVTNSRTSSCAVRLRYRCSVVSGGSVLRTILRDLPASGEHPPASEACGGGAAVRLDLLLHLDLPSGVGLEQIHCEQDRNHL